MKKLLLGVAALALSLGVTFPAQAQQINRTQIVNSGNGALNAIAVHNRGFGLPAPYLGAAPVGWPGSMAVGPVNINVLANSGNGQGNTIALQNRGGFAYAYPGGNYGGVLVGGVNVNVLTNSANGVGNSIGITNH